MPVAVVAGVLLLAFVAVDVFLTSLAPASSPPVSTVLSRTTWYVASHSPARLRESARRLAGPVAIVASVLVWLGLLWVGFALLYLPLTGRLAWSPDVGPPPRGLPAALYLSGASLTTLGFGDVVGRQGLVRALTVLEAAGGLGVITATLGYLPAIYTLVSDLRAGNQAVADLEAEQPVGAAELLTHAGPQVLDTVRRDVVSTRQHLQRFPVLHYFHPPYDESVVALARGALGLWVAAVVDDPDDVALRRHALAMRRALDRLVDGLAVHGGRPQEHARLRAEQRFAQALDAVGRPAGAGPDDDQLEVLARWEAVLDSYARLHDYPQAAGKS